MIIVASIFELLAGWVALANIVGCVTAKKDHGYSCVPLLSLLFCTIAFFVAGEPLGYWLFVPAIIDPGTLVVLLVPGYLIYRKFLTPNDKSSS